MDYNEDIQKQILSNLEQQNQLLRELSEQQNSIETHLLDFFAIYVKLKNPNVFIKDINMSMGSMFEFMIKWVIASIPVGIIIGLIWIILIFILN